MGIACSLPVECMATRCWDVCIGDHRVKYVRDLPKNLESLQTLLSELSAQRADISSKVEAAEQCQGLKRLQIVDKWLNDVTTAEREAGNLIQDSPKQIQKLCFGGCCSKNCILSYKFGKKVDQQLNVVRDLLGKPEKEDFKVLIGTQRLEQVELIPMRPPVGLDSTFDRAWSCIQNENVETIGIYGPGGVGKTTLLKQINNRLSETDFFVIWVVVSKGCNPEKLQEDIGKSLRFSNDDWKMKSYGERAKDIFKNLKQKKFALLLDDIWEYVDLTEMGIPSQMRANEFKIVLTSRSIQVCGQMRANEKIMVEYLADAETFKLFCETVGKDTLASNPKIPELAKIVVKECAGLPLALITVARAMIAKQTPEEWDSAIEILRSYATEFPDMTEKVYSCLKFSYDNLPNEMVKSCFLYCCLFREDMIINKSELIEYWICEGFLGEKNIKCNRNRGFDIIGTLLSACLVEKYDDKYIKMHDVTREMAFWISQEFEKDKHGSVVRAGFMLMEVPRVEEWEGKRRVSLMHNKIKQLQEAPSCSHLKTLFMNNNELEMITGQFFQGMPFLVVLNLSYNEGLRELPSEISKLVYLEYLNLSDTGLQKLPIGLNALIRLIYLNLEGNLELEIQCNVISNFQKLQTLNLRGTSLKTEDAGMFFEELRSLKHLETLDIIIDTRVAYHEFQSSNTLHSCIKNLTFDVVEVRVSILANMEHLESLWINCCNIIVDEWDTKRVKEDGGETSMNVVHSMTLGKRLDRLQYVKIEGGSGIADLSWLILAPNLTHIHVSCCSDIIEVINMENLGESENLNLFAKLETLELLCLPNLQSICKYALSFPQLKTLRMRRCEKLKKLPINSSTSKDIKFIIWSMRSSESESESVEKEWWNNLEWEDEATRIAFSNRVEEETIWVEHI
ncbi:hypothetical protein ACFE04_010351 [Oxalis oulophora]